MANALNFALGMLLGTAVGVLIMAFFNRTHRDFEDYEGFEAYLLGYDKGYEEGRKAQSETADAEVWQGK